MTRASVKICGLSSPETVDAAVEAGARYVGLNFYPPSPRAVSPQLAAMLALRMPPGVAKVGVFVDPDNATLDAIQAVVPLDFIQIHSVSDTARLAEIKSRVGLPLITAAPIAEKGDVERTVAAAETADMILFDAKPPDDAILPGGNGIAFDWRLLSTQRIAKPWLLSGGLTPENVAEAIALTGAQQVDVSSGVESAPGVKDIEKIKAFIENAGNGETGE